MNLDLENLEYSDWKQSILENGNLIKEVVTSEIVRRDNNEIKRALIDCKLQTPEGNIIQRCMLLGRKSVVIVPVLICDDDKSVYTIMVEQRRIVHGGVTVEFPEGDVSKGLSIKKAAAEECAEEINLRVIEDDLVPLNTEPIWVSPGYTYNPVYFFYFEKNIDTKFILDNNLAKAGDNRDGEYITTKIISMNEVQNIYSSNAIIGIKLLEKKINKVFN